MNELNYGDTQQATLMTVLRRLLGHVNLSVNALAKELNLPTPTINRLLTGEVKDPRASTLIAIADYFEITIDQLLGKETLNGKLAVDEHGSSLISKPPMSVPILTLTEATKFEKYCKTSVDWIRWQKQFKDNEKNDHKDIFAVNIKNNLYEPTFNNGTFIIVNPNINPNSGDYVLVSFLGDSTAAIKKYIAEGHYKYLSPLKPGLKIIMLEEGNCCIIGVIIEAYIRYKN